MKKLCLCCCVISVVCSQCAYSSSDIKFDQTLKDYDNAKESMIHDSLYIHFKKNKAKINKHFCQLYTTSFEEITKAVSYCLTKDVISKDEVIDFGFSDISNFSIPNLNAFSLYNYMKIVIREREHNTNFKFDSNKVQDKRDLIIELAKKLSHGVNISERIEKSISDISYYMEYSGMYEWFDAYYNDGECKEFLFPYISNLCNDGSTYYLKRNSDSDKFSMNDLFINFTEKSDKNGNISYIDTSNLPSQQYCISKQDDFTYQGFEYKVKNQKN